MRQFLRLHGYLVKVDDTTYTFVCRELVLPKVDLGCRLTDSQGLPLDLTQVKLLAVTVLTVTKDDRHDIINATVYAKELPLITDEVFSSPLPAELLNFPLNFPELARKFTAFRYLPSKGPEKNLIELTLAVAKKEVEMRSMNKLLEFEDLNRDKEYWKKEVAAKFSGQSLQFLPRVSYTQLSLEQKFEESARRVSAKVQVFDFRGREMSGSLENYDFSVLLSLQQMSLILYTRETASLLPLDVWTQGLKVENRPAPPNPHVDLVNDLIFDIGAALRLAAPGVHRDVFDNLQDNFDLLRDFTKSGTRTALPEHYAAVGICTHCQKKSVTADGSTLCNACEINEQAKRKQEDDTFEMQCQACRGSQELIPLSCRCLACEKCLMHSMIAGGAPCAHGDAVPEMTTERLKALFNLRNQRRMCAQCGEHLRERILLPCQHALCNSHTNAYWCRFCGF